MTNGGSESTYNYTFVQRLIISFKNGRVRQEAQKPKTSRLYTMTFGNWNGLPRFLRLWVRQYCFLLPLKSYLTLQLNFVTGVTYVELFVCLFGNGGTGIVYGSISTTTIPTTETFFSMETMPSSVLHFPPISISPLVEVQAHCAPPLADHYEDRGLLLRELGNPPCHQVQLQAGRRQLHVICHQSLLKVNQLHLSLENFLSSEEV